MVTVQSATLHDKINPFGRIITHLGEMDISFVLNNINDISVVLFNIPSRFLLYSEYYLLSPEMHKKVTK